MKNKVNVLGTVYQISERTEKEDEKLEGNDGYCDRTVKLIVIEKLVREQYTLADLEYIMKKVLRHEIVHAFLIESGLNECSQSSSSWALNEEMVDWLAVQGPKIYDAWREADSLE